MKAEYPPHLQRAIDAAEKAVGHAAPFSDRERRETLNGTLGLVAKGRIRHEGMNKTEARYAEHLEGLRLAGNVLWYKYEAIKLRLADNTFYTPDFFVMLDTSELQVIEVKGYWEDDARVKVKVAASLYPFQFIGVTVEKGGGWKHERF